ncbi:hypothetical protein EJ05DRAFT_497880 [Pseudovirgaria hyperparasitica]|uniref:DASH complex subunit DUO1 n=1 Tax=Pseudovirgaria hyperparasitica TaxID=470096 RepID=A0A6A6WES6_9PEZI|nr:uncharacterized protein EJ05DRAFT_497880 [Pseudovirgaria hyperparasitica]KAF2761328.1 hypothetical protein EJ05DRAFT_497880 [Pseudovirgaria hyperparasitica]
MDSLNFSDTEDSFQIDIDTPGRNDREIPDATLQSSSSNTTARPESRYSSEEAREAALRRELENVQNVNKAIEDVVASLEKAKENMGTVNKTVTSASTLLQTWTRILSQTEHNQRLILNPTWHGATQDLQDIESEAVEKQQAAERRQVEEQMRKEAAVRKAEDDERKKAAATMTRGTGRGRVTRGRASSTTAPGRTYTGVGGQGGRGLSRTNSTRGSSSSSSGIGRGVRGTRRT